MKNIVPFFILILLLSSFGLYTKNNFFVESLPKVLIKVDMRGENYSGPIDKKKMTQALSYCKKQKLDTTIAFFADMSIHSGKKRFFVVDLQKNSILHSGLCCHGMGKGSRCDSIVFSNEKGSNCTSLGKYKTGIRSYSNWGINIHYKMHGLEKTNSNAFQRIVVLHSYDPVPETEIYPDHLPLGWSQGCPVISNDLMNAIDGLLKKRKIPVLVWMYN
jgi:hypothetical protein